MKTITCETHGEIDWQGDIQCVSCKRIFLCAGVFTDPVSKKSTRRYPDAPPKGMCSCGKRLFGGTEMTARPACRTCAERVIELAQKETT